MPNMTALRSDLSPHRHQTQLESTISRPTNLVSSAADLSLPKNWHPNSDRLSPEHPSEKVQLDQFSTRPGLRFLLRVTSLIHTFSPRSPSLRVERMFHGCIGSG